MKKKDLNDIKAKSPGELKKLITDLEKEKVNSTFELKMGKSKNVHLARNKRKDIAKIKTFLNLKLIASEQDLQKS